MSVLFHITASGNPTQLELDELTNKFRAAIASNDLNDSIVATRDGVQFNIIYGPDQQQQSQNIPAPESEEVTNSQQPTTVVFTDVMPDTVQQPS